jgi:hypothetical protein
MAHHRTQLMMLMHGTVTSWAPTTSGDRDRDPRPTGDSNPVVDQYDAAYNDAAGQIGRQRVLNEAREELARWRGHGIKRHEGESQEERDRRMLREGQGFDPQTVAVRFDTNAGRVRKLRVAHGHLPETGTPLPGVKPVEAATPERVLELAGQGCTLRQITTITGVSKSTVQRMLPCLQIGCDAPPTLQKRRARRHTLPRAGRH